MKNMKTKLLKKLRKEAYDRFKIVILDNKFHCFEYCCRYFKEEWTPLYKIYPYEKSIFNTLKEASDYLYEQKRKWILYQVIILKHKRDDKLIQNTRAD